ncbi:MAG: metalloregulator ArsR/SmtB family transcription factor [Crocinitomicaceae bacterium]|nr:metalloregulator ArsR/SmtB family transcription factor [Crocinitomicaceae bacterium]
MGATKKHFYPESQLLFSNLCKALGHPARVSIVEMLSKNEHLNCSDLFERIELSQSTISRHCQILHQQGIIGYEVIGNNCFYRLDNRVLDKLTDFVDIINIEIPSITGNVYYPENRL